MKRTIGTTFYTAMACWVGCGALAATYEDWNAASRTNHNWYGYSRGVDAALHWLPTGGAADSGHVAVPLVDLSFIQNGYWPAYAMSLAGREPSQDIDLNQDRWLTVSLKLAEGSSLGGGHLRFFMGEWLSDDDTIIFVFNDDLQSGENGWVTNSQLVGDPSRWTELFRVGSTKRPQDLFRSPQQYGFGILAPTTASFTGLLHIDDFAVAPEPVELRIHRPLFDHTVLEHDRVVFGVEASCPVGIGFKWFKDGVPIDGAQSRRLIIDPADLTTAGLYRVEVFTIEGLPRTVISEARLKVVQSGSPLGVREVRGVSGTIHEVRIRFDQPVDPTYAQNLSHYHIGGLTITRVSLATNRLSLTLSTSPQRDGGDYLLEIRGLQSAGTPVTGLTATVPFTSSVSYRDEVLQDRPDFYFDLSEATGRQVYDSMGTDPSFVGTLSPQITLQADRLVAGAPDLAIALAAEHSDVVAFNVDSAYVNQAGPYEHRTIEFWFRAYRLPGFDAVTWETHHAVLWEEGGNTRGLAIYLAGTLSSLDPTEAELVFHAWNSAEDDGGFNTPWGLETTRTPVYVRTNVQVNTTYHVVLVLDGDADGGFQGRLDGYVNGQRVAAPLGENVGVGLLYAHWDNAGFGGVNQNVLYLQQGRSGISGTGDYFTGVLDELAIYNQALSEERVQVHYRAGLTEVPPGAGMVDRISVDRDTLLVEWRGGGTLQRAETPEGVYFTLFGTKSPYLGNASSDRAAFFRVVRP